MKTRSVDKTRTLNSPSLGGGARTSILVIVFCFSLVSCLQSYGQSFDGISGREAKEQLTHLVKEEIMKGEQNKQEMLRKLQRYIEISNPNQLIDLNLVLAFTLLNIEREVHLRQSQEIFKKIILASSESWQGDLARFGLTGSINLSGNYEQTIKAAKEALERMNLKRLDGNDKGLIEFKSVFPVHADEIYEGLKMILASAYCRVGKTEEAEKVLGTMKNEGFAKIVAGEIEYKKKLPDLKKWEADVMEKRREIK